MRREKRCGRLWRLIRKNASFLIVIIAVFLALTLIVGLTFGSFYTTSRQNAITIGNMTVAQEARRIEDSLYAGINTLLVASYTVDSMLSHHATPQEIETYLVQETQGIIMGIDPNFSGIYGVVQDVYVDGVGWQPEPDYDPYSRPWYLAAAEKNGELALVSPYVDAQTGNVMISFSKILSDGRSAISFDAELGNIYAVTETIQLNGKGYCFLVDMKGQVIAHREHDEVGKNYLNDPAYADSDIRALLEQVYLSSDEEVLQDVILDGKNCMVFTKNVREEWCVVLVVDSADLFANIRTSLTRNILVSLAIFALVGYFCTSNNINRKRAIQYANNIRIDALTGLNNRGEFDRYLHIITENIPADKKLYLLLFDADGFKGINDEYGHQEGDRALRLIADALRKVCHGTDRFCARYGGDEFVIICKSDGDAVACGIPDEIAQELRTIAEEKHLPYMLCLSCGIACFDPEKQSAPEFVDTADQSLYQMKARRHHRK